MAQAPGVPRRVRWVGVFTNREYLGLWTAFAMSLVGDQLARIALTVLVFAQTGSALATATAFGLTFLPWVLGGPLLSGLGDRYPRRTVMVVCDLARAVLVASMALPMLGLPVLFVLFFVAELLGAPFASARAALVRDVFPDDDRYARATSATTVTVQLSMVVGFAAGGALVALLSTRPALVIDAATFFLGAVLVRATVRHRPAPHLADGIRSNPLAGAAVVFGDPLLRGLALLAWLAAFFVVPEGIAVPYAAALGGGAPAVGLLLAAMAAGTAASMILVGRLPSQRRWRLMYPMAVMAGVPLVACAADPGVTVSVLLWAAAGAGTGYQLAANVSFVAAVPNAVRAQAFGLVGTGLYAGQGLSVVLAGALTDTFPPHDVVAVAGAVGTLAAAALAVTARRAPPAVPKARAGVVGRG